MANPRLKAQYIDTYRNGLVAFVGEIERAQAKGLDQEDFLPILSVGITRFGLLASELATDFDLSKGAVSKWVNGQAAPNRITQRAAIDWVLNKARMKVDELDRASSVARSSENVAELAN
jgi:hypothetical protein